MSDLPAIAVFADSPAQRRYLEDIVRAGGFALEGEETACLALAAPGVAVPADLQAELLTLGLDLPAPARAARVIEALHRLSRRQAALPPTIRIGPFSLNTRENIFEGDGRAPVRLTEKETAILACLNASGGKAMARDELLARVWSYADGVETHTLETHIYRLRQKIEQDPSRPDILLTEEDGYRLRG